MNITKISVVVDGCESCDIDTNLLSANLRYELSNALVKTLLKRVSKPEVPKAVKSAPSLFADEVSEYDDIPMFSWCEYTDNYIPKSQKQMGVRRSVVDTLLSDNNNWLSRDILNNEVHRILPDLKLKSIDVYIGGMIKAGIVEKVGREPQRVRLTQEFINQIKEAQKCAA